MNLKAKSLTSLLKISPLSLSIALSFAATAEDIESIERITVNGKRNQANSEVELDTQKLLDVAGIAQDPLNSVYSLPGVVYSGGDDGGEPAIRGSSPDDNAFYIDDMPVDYIFHLFGDSIFNENIVSEFSLHPAAFGSEYGGATGGIFDVKLRDPRNQDFKTTIDLSMLKLGFMVETGTAENQAAYFSYRRSLMQLFLPEGHEEDGYTVFKAPVSDDYQGKYQWLIGNDSKLTLTIAGASDVGGINISDTSEIGRIDPDTVGDLELRSKFDSQSLSWQHFGKGQKIFHASVSHSTTESKESLGQGQYIHVEDEEVSLRLLYQADWFEQHKLILGTDFKSNDVNYSYDAIPYYCTDHEVDCAGNKGERQQDDDNLKETNLSIFVKDIWSPFENWEFELGLRAERSEYTGQTFIHPRTSLTWFTNSKLSIQAKAGSYSRFPDIETVLPKIGNKDLQSPIANHYGIKFQYQHNDIWKSSVDLYYKDLDDLPRSLDINDENYQLHYDDNLSGAAYGLELMLEKEISDNWYGWASISYSKSERTDDIQNITTEYYLDTPLMVNAVANYQLDNNWDFGLRLSIRSGAKYTPIVGLRANPDYEDSYLPEYGELNSKDLPTYVRLDLQANYSTTLWGNNAQFTFAILNATGNDNISGYYFAPDGEETPTNFDIKGEEGLETFPSIGVKIEL